MGFGGRLSDWNRAGDRLCGALTKQLFTCQIQNWNFLKSPELYSVPAEDFGSTGSALHGFARVEGGLNKD